jgi:coenzyme F420 hydrogenase subunit beta
MSKYKQSRLLGSYINLYEAATAIDELKGHRGGGDIVTSLLVYGLKYRIFDQALVVKMSESEPWKAIPVFVTTPEDVIGAAGSKYAYVSFKEVIKRATRNSAIVGLPCQINRNSNYFKIGLFDGIVYTEQGMNYYLRKNKIDKSDIASLDYRAPYSKRILIKFNNGSSIEIESPWWLGYFFHERKCLLCQDYTSHNADISVGDRRFGYSSVITRTKRGDEMFTKLIEDEYIHAERVTLDNFLAYCGSSLMQKEDRGGFINTRLVSIWGDWARFIPLRLLRPLGKNISRILKG